MKILHLGLGLVLWCTEFFNVSNIPFIYLFSCWLCFWYEVMSHCGLGLHSFMFIYLSWVLAVARRIFSLCCRHVGYLVCHVGSSSLVRDQTQALCIVSVES